jgi:hypothetical protein
MCRKAINKALRSVEKTPAGLDNLNPNPPTPVRWTANPALPSINEPSVYNIAYSTYSDVTTESFVGATSGNFV